MGFGATILSFIMSIALFASSLIGISPEMLIKKTELDDISSEEAVSAGKFVFFCDEEGFDIAYDGVTMLENAETRYILDDITYSSLQYENYKMAVKDTSDERGNGKKITVTYTGEGLKKLIQHFVFYNNTDYFLVSAEITSGKTILKTNYIAPVVVTEGRIQNGNPSWTTFLEVPFSNDNGSEFDTSSVVKNGMSHEVGAFFSPDDKDGFIIGSVTHNVWKSAVSYVSDGRGIEELYAFSGVRSDLADQAPHGTVSGYSVSSAIFLFGFYENWKDGMNEFADVNLSYSSKRDAVIGTKPFGWDSRGAKQDYSDYSFLTESSDFIKENFQGLWEKEGDVVYITVDAVNDNLSKDELKEFVSHCKANGQTPGVYFSPFATDLSLDELEDRKVAGTDYTFSDIVLRNNDGDMYSPVNSRYPLDVTHPGTKAYYKAELKELISYGFKCIKLHYLTHGALEGDFYNDEIITGIQAYNYAMKDVCKIIGNKVCISMVTSPVFPYCYANAKRICGDTYSDIKETENMLNALTYGFWQSRFYDYLDCDHVVLWGSEGNTSYKAAKSRLLSAIVTGGSFITGDNFVYPEGDSEKAAERFKKLLSDEKILALLSNAEAFEPRVEKVPSKASEAFSYIGEKGAYVAAFNYSKFLPSFNVIDVPEGLVAVDILSGKVRTYNKNKLVVLLSASDCAIYKLLTKEEYELTLSDEATTEEEVSIDDK